LIEAEFNPQYHRKRYESYIRNLSLSSRVGNIPTIENLTEESRNNEKNNNFPLMAPDANNHEGT